MGSCQYMFVCLCGLLGDRSNMVGGSMSDWCVRNAVGLCVEVGSVSSMHVPLCLEALDASSCLVCGPWTVCWLHLGPAHCGSCDA